MLKAPKTQFKGLKMVYISYILTYYQMVFLVIAPGAEGIHQNKNKEEPSNCNRNTALEKSDFIVPLTHKHKENADTHVNPLFILEVAETIDSDSAKHSPGEWRMTHGVSNYRNWHSPPGRACALACAAAISRRPLCFCRRTPSQQYFSLLLLNICDF